MRFETEENAFGGILANHSWKWAAPEALSFPFLSRISHLIPQIGFAQQVASAQEIGRLPKKSSGLR